MKIDIEKMVNMSVRELEAYKPETIICSIRMEANENPFTINSSLKELVLASVSKVDFNRYPDSLASDLRDTISEKSGVKPDNILIGNGSDEIIQMMITAFCEKSDKVLYPVPTFSMFGIIAKSLGISTIEIPLNSEWDMDLEEIKRSYEKYRPKIIFLSSPNNPTGNCFSGDKILEIIKTIPCFVVVDEAYADFCEETFIGELNKFMYRNFNVTPPLVPPSFKKGGIKGGVTPQAQIQKPAKTAMDDSFLPAALRLAQAGRNFEKVSQGGPNLNNLIILKTLSKIGMAGLRVGYLIANEKIINILHKVRLPYNSNSLSQAAAKVILENSEVVKSQIQQIIKGREFLWKELQDIGGIIPFPSRANFILFKTKKDADDIHKRLTEEGILIRNLNTQGPLRNCLRVTVGQPFENEAFIKALKKVTL